MKCKECGYGFNAFEKMTCPSCAARRLAPGPHVLQDPDGEDRWMAVFQERLKKLGWVPWWEVNKAKSEKRV